MIKVLSLFSGIGAFEKALQRQEIEHEVVNYCEIDKYASRSYSAIHGIPEEKNLRDVMEIDTDKLPDFDLMTWGFPCQDISVAGKQRGIKEGTRSGLYYEGFRILKAKRPDYSIIENVKNLIGEGHRDSFIDIIKDITGIGYNCYWKVLNAKDFGIPQNRERIFIVSIKKEIDTYMGWEGLFPWPIQFDNGLRLRDFLEDEVDEKLYISDEKSVKLINSIKNIKTLKTIRTGGRGSLDAKHSWDLVCVGNTNPSGNGMNGNVYAGNCSPTLTTNKGEGLKILELSGLYVNCSEKFIRNPLKGLSRTLKANQHDASIIGPEQRIRKLTPKECWRLMGFDDEDFDKAKAAGISNSQLYKQAGNSIVVNVLEGILKGLFN